MKDRKVSDFLDTMYSNLLLPHIACPTRVTVNSQTLVQNIFSNNYDSPFTSGNLVTTLSDQHALLDHHALPDHHALRNSS